MDEEEIWKCQKHPSKRRITGICAVCLRDRLLQLCPNCANVRPCACCSSSSSSSSPSFSLSSSLDAPKCGAGIGAVGRVSNLINSEPAFRRSRSNTFAFIRRIPTDKDAVAPSTTTTDFSRSRSSSLWSMLKSSSKTKKAEEVKEENPQTEKVKMRRSKSVGVSSFSDLPAQPTGGGGGGSGGESKMKVRSWYFPSPMKVFRHPKTTKVVQEMSPLCRG